MSDTATPTTGATDEQIEAAGTALDAQFKETNDYFWGEEGHHNNYGPCSGDDIVQAVAPYLVPPGMVIAPAADVLTAEDRAALIWDLGIVLDFVKHFAGDFCWTLAPDVLQSCLALDAILARLAAGGDGR